MGTNRQVSGTALDAPKGQIMSENRVRSLYETGGSTVVSLPPSKLDELGLGKGSNVVVDVVDGRLTLVPVSLSEA